MTTIWKFPLQIRAAQTVSLPFDSEILTVRIQNGSLVLWAWVNDNSAPRERRIHIRGTGHICDGVDSVGYIATVQDGPLVWHVFDGGWAK